MLKNAMFTAFPTFELFKENQEGGVGQKISSTHSRTYIENPLICVENRVYSYNVRIDILIP